MVRMLVESNHFKMYFGNSRVLPSIIVFVLSFFIRVRSNPQYAPSTAPSYISPSPQPYPYTPYVPPSPPLYPPSPQPYSPSTPYAPTSPPPYSPSPQPYSPAPILPPSPPPPTPTPPTLLPPPPPPPPPYSPSIAPTPTSPSPSPSPQPSPCVCTLNTVALANIVQKIADIITGPSENKADDLFKIYTQYPNNADKIAIEKAVIESNSLPLSQEVRRFLAAFLFNCGFPDAVYSYHLANNLQDNYSEDVPFRRTSLILVACSESSDLNTALQFSFKTRYQLYSKQLADILPNYIGENDAKNVCTELLNRKREALLEKPDLVLVEINVRELLDEEHKTDGWRNKRQKLDTTLISSPLNQAKLVVEKFSKDGKNLTTVIEEDFHKDGDKKTVYLQLCSFISSNITFFSDELYVGLQGDDVLSPMIILGAVKRSEDLRQIEDTFQKNHKDMNMRDKVRELTGKSQEYSVKFFQKILDIYWNNVGPTTNTPPVCPAPPEP